MLLASLTNFSELQNIVFSIFQTCLDTLYVFNLPSTKTPMRYGVGASNKAVIFGGNAGISVCCHINGKSKDSMASKSADKSLEKEKKKG